ncbi:transglutaminase domain-containing protein [Myxococcota bacterium]
MSSKLTPSLRFVVLSLLVAGGCRTGRAPGDLLGGTPPESAVKLQQAAEGYYAARTVEELEAALAEAHESAPESAVFHELAANLAFLRADHAAEFDHLLAALRDLDNDAPMLHLEMLDDFSWTLEERARVEALLAGLVDSHPDYAVRAKAAYKLAGLLYLRGDVDGSAQALGAITVRLPFAVIGTWDNEQGKGFDATKPPESDIDLSGRYDGSLLQIGWRRDLPLTPDGGDLDLGAVMSPTRWSLAYAVSAVRVAEAGKFELRLLSSVPIRVWVNGSLIYEERRIERSVFDQVVLPVFLRQGSNRILMKTAQNTGTWKLSARLTQQAGAPARGVEPVEPDEPVSEGPGPGSQWSTEQLIDRLVSSLPAGSARQMFHKLAWSRILGYHNLSIAVGDALAQRFEGTLPGRYALAGALWNHDERGRTADVLSALDAEVGEQLPYLRMQQARFHEQESLTKDAREALLGLREIYPRNPMVWARLANHFEKEGWLEDQCEALEKAAGLRPTWLSNEMARASCQRKLGFELRAIGTYEAIQAELPNHTPSLRKLEEFAKGNEQLRKAESLADALASVLPHQPWAWLRLAESRRRRSDFGGAQQAVMRALQISPDSPVAYKVLGSLAYQRGDLAQAIAWWQDALVRDPSNEKLANRLAYLTPEEKEPWEEDVPQEEAIDAAVASRAAVEAKSGADVIDLLDHEVTRINADGSTINLVTQVMHAVNESGRDKLTRVSLRSGGRIRILHAYAVDPSGSRIQVSSIRDRRARFRGLKVGTTVVLQYRHDGPPVGFLARHVARGWWFQGVARQMQLSRWVVWAPAGTKFHEWILGNVERAEEARGETMRLSWTAHDVSPIIAEPFMPTVHETAMNMLISTVPDWATFLEWEKALLHEAFRESSEVKALAERLFQGIEDPRAKLDRLHRYLMKEIRYQQDYEDHIAGVKPHPATVVIKRAYGDCKDKAVLFVTLARLAGIEVHFTVVRTRSRGPLRPDVPMQQFNHAIVYVPPQKGIAEGRFYDPTADALDVMTLPLDDAGVKALVLDAEAGQHAWVSVPFQPAEMNRREVRTRLALRADGSAEGTLEIETVGHEGSVHRRLARNEQKLRQGMQMFVGHNMPGATASDVEAVEVEDLSKPARIRATVQSPAHGRVEGDVLKVTVPRVWSPDNVFRLAERKYPLVLGPAVKFSWRSELQLPEGTSVARLPSNGKIDAECFVFERRVTSKKTQVVVEQTFETRCERIPVDRYGEHRVLTEELIRLYKEELTIRLPSTAATDGNRAVQSASVLCQL